jgi:hypothetical protein
MNRDKARNTIIQVLESELETNDAESQYDIDGIVDATFDADGDDLHISLLVFQTAAIFWNIVRENKN